MNTKKLQPWARAMILINGIFYIIVAIALLFAPTWFFENIGHFPPFNRHYMGDLGSFILPMGIGLVIASKEPIRNMLVINAVLGASLIHIVNHVYDAIIDHEPLLHWVQDPGALLPLTIALLWAVWVIYKGEKVK